MNEAGGKTYGQGVTPWDLCESMQSSGSAHVDALRCDVIEYAFRVKGNRAKMVDDLRKAAHCATRAAEALERFSDIETAECHSCAVMFLLKLGVEGVCPDCVNKAEGLTVLPVAAPPPLPVSSCSIWNCVRDGRHHVQCRNYRGNGVQVPLGHPDNVQEVKKALPTLPFSLKCLDCGKKTLPGKNYCATCILEPGPR